LSSDLLLALGFEENDKRITTAAVCVYPSRVADARNTLARMNMADKIPIASGICYNLWNRNLCIYSTLPLFAIDCLA